MSEKLLPCPFCGSQSVFNRIPAVYCADCGAQGKYTDDPEYRAKAWNTRVGVAPARLTADPAPFLGVEAKMPKYEYQKDSSQGGVGAFSGCGEYRPVTVSCSTVIPKPSTASTDKPAAIEYRGIALAAHNRATPVAPDASTPVQRPHE